MLPCDGHALPIMTIPIKGVAAGAVPPSPPPRAGEHTRAVLTELGYGEDELQALTAEGAIAL
jgi:crotonobetainyl-CoA:carnitine CoA-transferase CaiB-like acyl-CoA transferase